MSPGERESFSWTNFMDVLGSSLGGGGGSDDRSGRESGREAGAAQNVFSLCGDLSENKLPPEQGANMTPGLRNTRSRVDKRKRGVKMTSRQRTLKLILTQCMAQTLRTFWLWRSQNKARTNQSEEGATAERLELFSLFSHVILFKAFIRVI